MPLPATKTIPTRATNMPQTVRLSIRSLNGLVPLATIFAGTVILAGFGLNDAVHAEIRRALDARRRSASDDAGETADA